MNHRPHWKALGWRHDIWELVRYYRSLRLGGEAWLKHFKDTGSLVAGNGAAFPIRPDYIAALDRYLSEAKADFPIAFEALRTEGEALAFCGTLGAAVRLTTTRSRDHHQAPKALVAAVSTIAARVCGQTELTLEANPQRRAIWLTDRGLHVSARNLDGAIPGLANPLVVWEIKEYWGKTSGGSKMSDAVYECQLVGRELREYEEKSGVRVRHVVFVDGCEQWSHRKSDLTRFIDLFHQGIIDELIVGRQVESEWEPRLAAILSAR